MKQSLKSDTRSTMSGASEPSMPYIDDGFNWDIDDSDSLSDDPAGKENTTLTQRDTEHDEFDEEAIKRLLDSAPVIIDSGERKDAATQDQAMDTTEGHLLTVVLPEDSPMPGNTRLEDKEAVDNLKGSINKVGSNHTNEQRTTPGEGTNKYLVYMPPNEESMMSTVNVENPPLSVGMTRFLDGASQLVLSQCRENSETGHKITALSVDLKNEFEKRLKSMEETLVAKLAHERTIHIEEVRQLVRNELTSHKEAITEDMTKRMKVFHDESKLHRDRLEIKVGFGNTTLQQLRVENKERALGMGGNKPQSEPATGETSGPGPEPTEQDMEVAQEPKGNQGQLHMGPPAIPMMRAFRHISTSMGGTQPNYRWLTFDWNIPEQSMKAIKFLSTGNFPGAQSLCNIPVTSGKAYRTLIGYLDWNNHLEERAFFHLFEATQKAESDVKELKKVAIKGAPLLKYTQLFKAQLDFFHADVRKRAAGSLLYGLACGDEPRVPPHPRRGKDKHGQPKAPKPSRIFNLGVLQVWTEDDAYREAVRTIRAGEGYLNGKEFSAVKGIFAVIADNDYQLALAQPTKVVESEVTPTVEDDGISVLQVPAGGSQIPVETAPVRNRRSLEGLSMRPTITRGNAWNTTAPPSSSPLPRDTTQH